MLRRNFTTYASQSLGGTCLEGVPGERLLFTDRLDDLNLPSGMTTYVTLKVNSAGMDVSIEHHGIPVAIRREVRYLGGQEPCTSSPNS